MLLIRYARDWLPVHVRIKLKNYKSYNLEIVTLYSKDFW